MMASNVCASAWNVLAAACRSEMTTWNPPLTQGSFATFQGRRAATATHLAQLPGPAEPGSPRTRPRSRGPAAAAAPPTAGPIPAPPLAAGPWANHGIGAAAAVALGRRGRRSRSRATEPRTSNRPCSVGSHSALAAPVLRTTIMCAHRREPGVRNPAAEGL